MGTAWLAAAFLLGAPAQDGQEDARVRRALERIEREIRASYLRLREELRGLILSEIERARAAAPRRPYLGIVAGDLGDDERRALGIPGGIKVADVRGPAREAGVRPGDILLEIEGEPVSEGRIAGILGKYRPGDRVAVTVLRDRRRETLPVRLGERPE
jgi:S1-C subfamily serine protease